MRSSSEIFQSATRDWSETIRSTIEEDQFLYAQTIGSTNDHLMELAKQSGTKPFTLSLTEHQTAGRGRRGDAWIAPAGRNLLFSILLDLPDSSRHWSRLPHIIAWCLGSAVESLCGDSSQIQTKWPNDLYLRGKKLAGILVETQLNPRPRAIVGIGINVNMRPEEFPPELRDTAISLYEIIECESSRWYLLSLFLENLITRYPDAMDDFDGCLSWLRERDFLIGRKLSLQSGGKTIVGTAAGLNDDGALLLETSDTNKTPIITCESMTIRQS